MAQTGAAQRGKEQADAIRSFPKVNFPGAELTKLRRRINATRWPDREAVTDQSQGPQLATMQKLAHYWATEYDWRKVETRLNAQPNSITEIDGLDVRLERSWSMSSDFSGLVDQPTILLRSALNGWTQSTKKESL
jgi:hypothetical protein